MDETPGSHKIVSILHSFLKNEENIGTCWIIGNWIQRIREREIQELFLIRAITSEIGFKNTAYNQLFNAVVKEKKYQCRLQLCKRYETGTVKDAISRKQQSVCVKQSNTTKRQF